jgi:putative restriction endonuclease
LGNQAVDEVNFWRPLARSYRASELGSPFFFRLKAPIHAIAGFGFFAGTYSLPVRLAWDVFGEKNGDPTYERFLARIAGYRKGKADGAQPLTCVVLRNAVFLGPEDWIHWHTAEEWRRQIVTYKAYDLEQPPGARLAALLAARREETPPDFLPDFSVLEQDNRTTGLRAVAERQGQGAFRLRVMDAYQWRCSVTTEHALPVLDAAHIQPYMAPASNHVQNGLILRTDLHRLYDGGYITLTPDHRLEVSRRLREEFDNGEEYYRMQGRSLTLPDTAALRPSRDALLWHADHVFR